MAISSTAASPSDRLRTIVARHLKVRADELDPDRPLALYGLDSLTSMELLADVEDELGCRLPEWLFADHPTLASLTLALTDDVLSAADAFAVDAVLPTEFVLPSGVAVVDPPRTVLLTGATGFLGAYLLRTLIDETHVQVCCLVRAEPGAGLARVTCNLERYGLWRPSMADRIEIVRGDLAAPRFGLDEVAFEGLADAVDAIVHAGADVNWVAPYAALRDANVIGTREVIRLAMSTRPKTVHFVSSVSVCYVPGESALASESTNALASAARLPLGYAQTKAVAEALLREASARGLPVRVSRPGLIAGDSTTGASNVDDLMARLVKGCISMGQAPDLAWMFDAAPVDYVARRILHGSDAAGSAWQMLHVVQPSPRRWQECVLWMNLRGYPCALADYANWVGALEQESMAPSHPLHGLRRFFLQRDDAGVSAAEHLQEDAHAPVDSHQSQALANVQAQPCPPIDGALMRRYFDDYIARGFLPEPPVVALSTVRAGTRALTLPHVEGLLRHHLGDPSLRVTRLDEDATGSRHSIISELTSWRQGTRTGLFRLNLTCESSQLSPLSPWSPLSLVAKAKASDDDAIEVAETLARMCDAALGALVHEHRESIGLRGGHRREPGMYDVADASLRAHLPVCFGTWADEDAREWGVLLERLDRRARLDGGDAGASWAANEVDAALEALVAIHGFGYRQREALASLPWLAPARDVATMSNMTPLWVGLARHAVPLVRAAGGDALVARHAALALGAADWWTTCLRTPQTVIHHDFNPRNIALGGDRACPQAIVYDWELATWGAPQRDLMELLCFVLSPQTSNDELAAMIEGYRVRLSDATGLSLPEREWRAGCQAALSHVLVERLGFYALIDRVRPQTFLRRVLQTWQHLDGILDGRSRTRSGGER